VKGPSKPGTGNSAKGSAEAVVTTEDEQGNSIAPKVCIAVVGVAVLFSICLIYRSKTEQLKQRAADLWEQAQKRLDEKQIEDATRLLTQYSSAWQATELQKAQELLQQIHHVTSDSEVLKSLVELSESDFAVAESIHAINDGRISHPALLETRAVSIERNLAEAMRLRSEVVLRRERELAEAEARAEEDRQKQERAREEAERRAENDRIAVVGQSADTTRLLGLNKQEREQVRKEVASIEASLASADVTSRTVFQQQVARIDACIEATGLLASASYDYFIRERRLCLWLSANIGSDCLQVEMMDALFRGISRPSFSCQRRPILPFQPEVSRIRLLVRVVTYCSSWICFSRSWMNGSNFAMSAALLPCSCLRKPNR
jgi:hypothetical protein